MAVSTIEKTDFAALVELETRSWLAAAAIIVGSRARGEEVVQEVLARTFQRWKKVSKLDRPGAWVRRAVINEAISAKRSAQRERVAMTQVAQNLADAGVTEADPAHELWAKVRELPDDQCRAIALYYGADLSVIDVAADLDLSESATKTLLFRARKTLRTTVSDQEVTR